MILRFLKLILFIVLFASCVQDQKLSTLRVDNPFEKKPAQAPTRVDIPQVQIVSVNPTYVKGAGPQIKVTTGVEKINCETLTHFAITEEPVRPTEADYIHACDTPLEQIISYDLTDTTEGQRFIFIWAVHKDFEKYSNAISLGFTYDTTTPTGSVGALPSIIKGGTTETLTFSGADNTALDEFQVEYTTDGTNWVQVGTYSSSATSADIAFPIVDSAVAQARVQIVDMAGNTTTKTTSTFNLDSSGPTSTITDLPTVVQGSASQNITFSSSDISGVASWELQYSSDGTNFSTIATNPTSPYAWSTPAGETSNGVVRLVATDGLGNQSTTLSNTFVIDSTPPSVSLDPIASVIRGGASLSVTYTVSDASGISSMSLEYASDGTTYSPVATVSGSSYTWTIPTDNTTASRLRLTATDVAGNSNNAISNTFAVDSTGPVVTLDNLAAVVQGNNSTNVTFSASDTNGLGTATLSYAADGVNFSTTLATNPTSPYSWSVPNVDTTGSKLQYTVSDSVGNTTTVTNNAFNIDSSAPTISITDLPSPLQGGATQGITFSNSDTNGVASMLLEYSLDGINYTTISTTPTSPQTWNIPTSSTVNADIRLTATDNAGNVATTTSNTFVIDATPPTVSIDDLAAAILGGGTTSVTFSASDSTGITNLELQYAADGTTFSSLAASTSSPYSWNVPTSDTSGSRLKIIATDGVGNTNEAITAGFNVDSTGPSLTLDNLAASILGGSPLDVTFTASDANGLGTATLSYAADGSIFSVDLATDPSSPYSWSVPSVDTTGSRLQYSVSDSVGNVTTINNNPFNIDITPPTISITDLPSPLTGGGTQAISFTNSDTNGVASLLLEYSLDGVTYTTISTSPTSGISWSIPTTDSTNARIRLTATDNAGNIATTESNIFTVDQTPPTTNITDLPSVIKGGDPINVTFSASDATGSVTSNLLYAEDGVNYVTVATNITSPYSWSVPLSDTTGSTLRIVTTDLSGKISNKTTTAFVIDSTGPTLSLNDVTSLLQGGSTEPVSYTVSDTNGVANVDLNYSSNSGTSYSSVATNISSPYTWTVPSLNNSTSILQVIAADSVGNTTIATNSLFTIDSTPPTVSLNNPTSPARGGSTQSLTFSSTDLNGIASTSLQYSVDGVTFSEVISNPTSPYSWTLPTDDTSSARLRLIATDNAGNTQQVDTTPFIIDSTGPTLTINDIAEVLQGGSSRNLTYTYSDANGVSTWTLAFASDGVNFVNIVSDVASPYSWTVDSVDTSSAKIRISATDSVGNTNTATNNAFTIDSTAAQPSLSPVNFNNSTPTNSTPLTLTAASCSDITQIKIQESSTAPLATDPGWQTCSTLAGAITFDASVSNQQGFRTMRAYGLDPVGNISSPQLINFIFDTEAPQMSFENIPTIPTGITYPIKWTLTEASIDAGDNFTLEFSSDNGASWSLVASIPVGANGPHTLKSYSYDWSPPAIVTTQALFKISLMDNNGLTGTAQSNTFTILTDADAPNLLDNSMTINGSATPSNTISKYVNVSLQAIDSETDITEFCLKSDNTAPSVNDPCWRSVSAPIPGLTPSTSLDLVNFPHLLGYVPAVYNVYAWAKDLSGNISTNTGTVGKDLVTISYLPDSPPVLSNFFVSNTTSPANPITDSEMIFNTSDPVYVKWTATDDKGISSNIKLYYTTDDVSFTLITSGLSNGVNNCPGLNDPGTTLDDNSTGCYQWTSPFSSLDYFRLRLVVEDNESQATSSLSAPLNSGPFRVLAGNVDAGVGSSAKSAIFSPKGLYSLAVASDGKIFVNDSTYGLLYINPQTGVLEVLLEVTGTYSGDLGPVRSATAVNIFKITMDYEDRLIIWDGQRIRRVDTKVEPMQIETIIGGYNNGALGTEITDIVTNPADLSISNGPSNISLLHPMPNGDIYFQSRAYGSSVNNGNVLRVYRGGLASPDIQTIRYGGSGAYSTNNGVEIDLANDALLAYYLAYDPNTAAISTMMAKYSRSVIGCSYFTTAAVDTTTYQSLGPSTLVPNPHPPVFVSTCGDNTEKQGLDGNFYRIGASVAWAIQVSRYNPSTNNYTRVLGTGGGGQEGFCPDNTPALSCKIKISDIFISPSGKFFMIDNNTVRVIDDSGNVQTLYGQTKVFGDGGLAQDARFNSTPYLDHGVGDNVIIYDSSEKVIREIQPNNTTNQMYKLAGNGETGSINFANPAISQTLNGNSWDQPGAFVTDPTTGNVFFPCVNTYICRLNRSTGLWEQWAGGGGNHWLTTGTLGPADLTMGGYNKGILAAYNGKFLTGHYSWSGTRPNNSGIREFDMSTGNNTYIAGKYEEDGTTGCPDGAGINCNLNANRSTGRAFTFHTGLNKWLYEHNGNVLRLLNVNGTDGNISTFDTLPEPIYSMVWNGDTLYYCTEAGVLKSRNYNTSVQTTYNFPNNTIKCYGYNMLFKPASGIKPDRLVFPFQQNGLAGIAEFFLN